MGFLGGLLALFTPCVWPVIPMTVSFFLKRSKGKRKGVRDAFIYGFSIIAIFLLLGTIVTAFARPEALNALATNAWFNLFFFAMLIVFALSLFGWFELSLPSRWADRVDKKADELTASPSASSEQPAFFWFALHFPHGIYLGACFIFLYGTYCGLVACRSGDNGQPYRSIARYDRLCSCLGITLHALCPLSFVAKASTEVRCMDEHVEGDVGFP